MKVPIVCVSFGAPDYMLNALEIACMHGNDVVLICDKVAEGPWQLMPMDWFSDGLEELRSVFVHTGKKSKEFRFSSTARWLVFRNFARQKGLPIFTIDSDVCVFCDISEVYERYKQYAFTYSHDGSSGYAIGQAFWNSQDALDALCDDILGFYTGDTEPSHEASDMCHMRRIVLSGKFPGFNTYDVHDDMVLDHNIGMAQGRWLMNGGVKALGFTCGRAYCADMNEKKVVRFATLHCCHPGKNLIGRCHANVKEQLQG